MMPMLVYALDRAQTLEAMRRGFTQKSEPGANIGPSLVVLAIAAVALLALLVILNRLQQGKPLTEAGSSEKLFRHVMKSLGFGMQDRSLLCRVASQLQLPNPVVMLLTPELLAETVYDFIAATPGRDAKTDLARFENISRRLFGQELPLQRDADSHEKRAAAKPSPPHPPGR